MSWPSGLEVLTTKCYKRRNTFEMSCIEDEFLIVINYDKNSDCYYVKNPSGDKGMLPAHVLVPSDSFLLEDLNSPWLHGLISRSQTESLFANYMPGLFLVRESNNYKGDFTLCLCIVDRVEHYRINCENDSFTIDDTVKFDDLNSLILHYSLGSDGLAHKLLNYIDNTTLDRRDVGIRRIDDMTPLLKGTKIISHLSEIKMGEVIGKGEFADVCRATYDYQTVAIKCLQNTQFNQPFNEEAIIMSNLHHKNLVRLIAVKLSPNLGYVTHIVSEYVSNGCLVDYLRSRGRSVINQRQLIDFACDTCAGMAYLEREKIVHRDLAARNVLVTENHVAKISDFGLAHDFNEKHMKKQMLRREIGKVPIKWTAPEALREEKYTNKSDMWSFGVFLWEVYMFGRTPYPHVPINEIAQHVEKGYRMEKPDECSEEIYELMLTTWSIQAEKRPDFCTVKDTLEALRSLL